MSNRTPSKTAARPGIKEKRSFTLSRSSVAFLEKLRKQRKASSTSAVLDEILRETEQQQKKTAYEDAILAYYDNISEEEREENRLWGEFAMTQMRGEQFE